MSVEESHPQLREYYGVDPWDDVEPSEEETSAPEPLDQIGATVVCPACEKRMSERGYPHHFRRDHAGLPR